MLKISWPTDTISKWTDSTVEVSEEFVSEFVQELANQVVEATPVRTGFLRASWMASINSEPYGEGGQHQDMAGVAVTMKPGDVFQARNMANYGVFVEFGTQKMEPRAFVRGTLARAPEIAQTVLRRMRGG